MTPSVTERANRAGMSPVIAPSSDAASSSNWPDVGVDGVKMAAAPLLHDCSLSVQRRANAGKWEEEELCREIHHLSSLRYR